MSAHRNGMRIAVLCGSVRPGNYTRKAVNIVLDELAAFPAIRVEVIDPAVVPLPLPGASSGSPGTKAMQAEVSAATGVIFATPEYHGSFSSVTKLIIENLEYPSSLAGKPIALLGVAAGTIGAIKSLEHLRSVCAHVGGLVLPGPVSIANVQRVFDADGKCLDPAVEKRLRALPHKLVDYIERHLCPRDCTEQMVREGIADGGRG